MAFLDADDFAPYFLYRLICYSVAQLYFDFIAGELSTKPTASLELSILVGEQQFSYGICDTQQQLLAFRQYRPSSVDETVENFWQSVLSTDAYLRDTFWSIKVALESPAFSLIPDKLFDANASLTYLRNVASLPIGSAVSHCQIPALHVTSVYAAPINALIFAHHFDKKAAVIPDLAYILPALQADAFQNEGLQVYVIVRSGYVYTVLFEGFELLFANAFKYETAPELLYFTMLLFDQFKLSQEHTKLTLIGTVVPNSDIYALLYQYVQEIRFMPENPKIKFPTQFGIEFPHLYWELSALMSSEHPII